MACVIVPTIEGQRGRQPAHEMLERVIMTKARDEIERWTAEVFGN